LVPHGTPAPLAAAFSTNGKARAEASGLAGGLPGGAACDIVVRNTDIAGLLKAGSIPGDVDDLGGVQEFVQNRTETLIGLRDAVIMHPSGGGGYGDPLLRDPDAVAIDLRDGKVSPSATDAVYGVVMREDGSVDRAATQRRRLALRHSRIGGPPSPLAAEAEPAVNPLDANLALVPGAGSDVIVGCRHCGTDLGAWTGDPTAGALVREHEPAEALPGIRVGAAMYVDQRVLLRSHHCPGCGTQLRAAVVPVTERAR
jgi:N-methylhydantoinase B